MEDKFVPLDEETRKLLEEKLGGENVKCNQNTDGRRTFYIDVPSEKAEVFLEKMKEQLAKRKQINDKTI